MSVEVSAGAGKEISTASAGNQAVVGEVAQTQVGVGAETVERGSVLFDEGVLLENGVRLAPLTVAYEMYGRPRGWRDKVILVCHALSGGANAAGRNEVTQKAGWWDRMIGPGRAFDTSNHAVLCINVVGSCYGTTGPASIDPATGRPYGSRFPAVTIRDMVEVQRLLLDRLGIRRLVAVAGGSMGGMQALQWTVSYPERVGSVVALATTASHSALQIAFNEVARQAVVGDPGWNGGDYYDGEGPLAGLAVARMLGHITYLSEEGMARRFGRKVRAAAGGSDACEFEVASYLRHQGQSFVRRFDPSSLVCLTRAIDAFDLPGAFGSLDRAFAASRAPFLLLGFTSDWLYPTWQLREIASAVESAGGSATVVELQSHAGHDAFLTECERLEPVVRAFLSGVNHGVAS
jgi:homoserine O-acetyltransferase/O-succinyltransferase